MNGIFNGKSIIDIDTKKGHTCAMFITNTCNNIIYNNPSVCSGYGFF
jgi:hypothetical protein